MTFIHWVWMTQLWACGHFAVTRLWLNTVTKVQCDLIQLEHGSWPVHPVSLWSSVRQLLVKCNMIHFLYSTALTNSVHGQRCRMWSDVCVAWWSQHFQENEFQRWQCLVGLSASCTELAQDGKHLSCVCLCEDLRQRCQARVFIAVRWKHSNVDVDQRKRKL